MTLETPNPTTFVRRLWHTHAPLSVSAFLTLGLLAFFTAGLFLDERIITGVPAWLKPTKFAISISIYTFTLLWFLGFISTDKPWRKRLVSVLGWVVVLTFTAEWVAITTQAARGQASHFNVSDPLATSLWALMAGAIMMLWIANFIIAGLLLFQRFENPAFAWSLRLGLMITIIGMGLGYLMTSPTALQMAQWETGENVTVVGAHSVGVPDGGEGLPFVNWSTQGGDLRIGHFVGMHALQVIPFLGWLVTRRRRLNRGQLNRGQQTALVWTGAAGYLSITLLLTWQALRAQSIIQPDALTLLVFGSIVAVVVLSTVAIIFRSSARAFQEV